MKHVLILALAFGLVAASERLVAGEDDSREAVVAAARELSRQVDYLLRAIAAIPGPTSRRDLYEQAEKIQFDLIYFQQQLKRKAPREALLLAFDKMEQRFNNVMEELQGFERWDSGVKMTARRARSAEHDLHFALIGGAKSKAGQGSQTMYRQTLSLQARVEDLEGLVRYVFIEKDIIARWTADLEDLRLDLAAFQRAQKNKTERDELKQRFVQADQAWEKIVRKLRDLPGQQYFILQADAAQVEQVFARLAGILGVDSKREKLPGNYFD